MRCKETHGENWVWALLNPFLSHLLLRIFFLPISLLVPRRHCLLMCQPRRSVCADLVSRAPAVRCHLSLLGFFTAFECQIDASAPCLLVIRSEKRSEDRGVTKLVHRLITRNFRERGAPVSLQFLSVNRLSSVDRLWECRNAAESDRRPVVRIHPSVKHAHYSVHGAFVAN